MNKILKWFPSLSLVLALVLSLAFPFVVFAYTNGMSASVVLGQADYTSGDANRGGSPNEKSLRSPEGIATDGTHLAVADSYNNRVLIWNAIPTSIDTSADIVVGQTNFSDITCKTTAADTLCKPMGVAFAEGKLIVGDADNNRILIYNTIPTSNGASADVVIGQTAMNEYSEATSQTKLSAPWGVGYDSTSGKLVIVDFGNLSRVLIYNTLPTSNGAPADVVVGQPDFDTLDWLGTSATELMQATAAQIFDNKLFISDNGNSRVLIFNSVPTSNGAAANVVIGQTDMNSGDHGSTSADHLYQPSNIYYDGIRLFICDGWNDRILGYNSIPTSNGASADLVIGYSNFTDNFNSPNPSASNLSGPAGITGTNSKLMVSDGSYNRLLIYHDAVQGNSNQTTSSTTSGADPFFPEGYACRITTGPSVADAPGMSIISELEGDSGTQTMVAKDASVHDIHIDIERIDPVKLVAEEIPLPWEQGFNTAGEIYHFSLLSAFNGYPIPQFDKPVTVILSYDPTKLYSVNVNELRIAYYDQSIGHWVAIINNTVVNTVSHTVANTTLQYSYFAVVYPRTTVSP